MWLFLTSGFASVVLNQRPNEPELLVRFRARRDAENFVSHTYGEANSKALRESVFAKIIVSPEADYRYRVVVTRLMLTAYLAQQVMDLDYTNFKGAVSRCADQANKGHAYHRVWDAMHEVQTGDIIGGYRPGDDNREPGHGGELPIWEDLALEPAKPAKKPAKKTK